MPACPLQNYVIFYQTILPLYWKQMLDNNFDAAATEILCLFLKSYRRHCLLKTRSQYIQSAAPPAMVPIKYRLIGMIFLTLPEKMYIPPVALESTAMMTPPLYLKARVVVP